MVLAQLLKPEVFAKLTEQEREMLLAVVNAEIQSSPEIRKALQTRVDVFVPHLGASKKP
ncbi:hypothetical protein [Sorangium sp. So ce1097]|uniref:hypothetical protein n=1 Tax=Sorangium sp. So ce1097 TaxID=3133330 RepID=UPI003F620766